MCIESSPKSVLLFDLDGTLTQTDHLHLKAFETVLAPYGFTVDEDFYVRNIRGSNNADIFSSLFPGNNGPDRDALIDAKESLFREMASTQLVPTAGLPHLLEWAKKKTIPMAIVTNAPRENVNLLMEKLKIEGNFSDIIIGGELEKGKPHPLPYLTGLEKLHGTAGLSLAFEDSPSGIISACSAGLTVFAIKTDLPEESLREAGANYIISDFDDPILWDTLQKMYP